MRGRAFLGGFIALCLIAGCSSSSSDDAALKEALDRIESLEEELETKATTTVPPTTAAPTTTTTPPTTTSTTTTTTTTTIPTYDLEKMFARSDKAVYDYLSENPVKMFGDPNLAELMHEDWEKVLIYSGTPNNLTVEICYNGFLEGYVEFVFETLFVEDLGLSKTLAARMLRDRTDDANKAFEERQRGFYLEWLTDRNKIKCKSTWSTKVWITYEG